MGLKEAEKLNLKTNTIIRHLTFLLKDMERDEIQDEHIIDARVQVEKSLKKHLLRRHIAEHVRSMKE